MATAAKKTTVSEDFKPSFNAPGSVPDPTGKDAAGRNRLADKDQGESAMPKLAKSQMIADMVTKAATMDTALLSPGYAAFMAIQNSGGGTAEGNRGTIKAGKGLKEDVSALFEGQELSEEFKSSATTLFEAAVEARVVAERVLMEEQRDAQIEEGITEGLLAIEENVEKYLDHVAAQYLEENKLQIETGVRADILENFMGGLKQLFVEHYIDIPEDKVDVVEQLTSKVDELTERLNETQNELIEAKTAQTEAERLDVLKTVSEGLTSSQADQLTNLAESVEYTTPGEYEVKLRTISESFLVKKPAVKSGAEQLNEELELDPTNKPAAASQDPLIAAVAARISREARG